MPVTLRPVGPDDQDFLYKVYASTRRAEMAAWGWNEAQQDAFLRMQFIAQSRSYEAHSTSATHSIILLDGEPAGRLLVSRSEDEIQLTDISLLPEHRGHGIGTGLIKDLLDEAERDGRTVCLEVLRHNPAARLYARLGFVVTGEHDLYLQMRRHPTTA
ncbi:MAG: GNAT family N-acetyltransferase [Acidobacteria bacterium]|nr:GNAT family N-acetyltransferase [Acidobacteriota bacterium]